MRPIVRMMGVIPALLSSLMAPEPSRADESPVVSALRPFVDRNSLAGAAVLVANRDRVLSLEAVGYSDVAARTPMKVDDLFWIASMSKPITATALMMLVDEGKIQLDVPVEKYLPEFHGQMVVLERKPDRVVLKKPAHPILVREILSHTSGLVGRSPLERELDVLPLKIGTITYGLSPLQFEPGTKYEYCNPGINTAGRLIEVVSGVPYEEFLQKRLFEPLGMKDTTFWPDEPQLKRLAKSYKPGPDKPGPRGDPDHPAHLPPDRPEAESVPRGRPLLDGGGPRDLLPDDPERRDPRRPALCVGIRRAADDLDPDR